MHAGVDWRSPKLVCAGTFDLLPELAKIVGCLQLKPFGVPKPQAFVETREIRPSVTMKQLVRDPVWEQLIDILASRSYFDRLWTLQEISLSFFDNVTVYCGSYSVPWRIYRDAAVFLYHFKIHLKSFRRSMINTSLNVIQQASLQSTVQRGPARLSQCIQATSTRLATEPRDMIFGLLGMLDTDSRLELQKLNYSTSL